MLFTTFTKSIADKVSINPKYIEEQIDEINQDLWEVVKYYFSNQRSYYLVDDKEKTLTRKENDGNNFLFYYNTGSATRPYEGEKNTGFRKILNRITIE